MSFRGKVRRGKCPRGKSPRGKSCGENVLGGNVRLPFYRWASYCCTFEYLVRACKIPTFPNAMYIEWISPFEKIAIMGLACSSKLWFDFSPPPQFKMIFQTYAILPNPEKRWLYDDERGEEGASCHSSLFDIFDMLCWFWRSIQWQWCEEEISQNVSRWVLLLFLPYPRPFTSMVSLKCN
jgi:hypothetical protein